MRSVKSIQKITKAMKMVAASKLRGVVVKAEQSRGMWQPFTALLGDVPGEKGVGHVGSLGSRREENQTRGNDEIGLRTDICTPSKMHPMQNPRNISAAARSDPAHMLSSLC